MKSILLFGPTAVGKTELISGIFKSRYEIINADSMQVYRGLNIGTAKPEQSLLNEIPHHLVDIMDPRDQFHAGDFVREADRLAAEIHSRGKIPVLAGGTAFYFRNYLYGLPESPEGDPELRSELKVELADKGLEALYSELKEKDPARAAELHSNDKYRILRSLEIIRGSGRTHSSFAAGNVLRPGIEPLIIGLERPREELYRRIDSRVDMMFRDGLIDEVKGCLASGLTENDPGMKGIGYSEFFLMKKSGEHTVADIADLIKKNSRNYAKRQLTFFRSLPGVEWFSPDNIGGIKETVERFVQSS